MKQCLRQNEPRTSVLADPFVSANLFLYATAVDAQYRLKSNPRPTPRTPSDGSLEGLLLVFCLVWIVGSLLAIVLFSLALAPRWVRYWRLQAGGQLAPGYIVRHDVGLSWYSYLYRFTPSGDPAVAVGQMAVPSDQFELLPANAPVDIRYLPGNPQISAIEPYFSAPPLTPLLYLVGGACSVLLGLVFLPGRWRAWQSVRRWRQTGLLAHAKVTHRWRSVDERDRDMFCVAYEFTANGKTIVAAENNRLAYESLKIGATCPVKYPPEAPQNCFLVLAHWIEPGA
jgi:hypothetical protein